MLEEKIEQEYVENQLIVIPKKGLGTQEIVRIQAKLNAKKLGDTPELGAELWELNPDMTPTEAIAQLKASGAFRYVGRNYIVTMDSIFPNDSQFDQLWGLNNTGQTGGKADNDIDAPEAWQIETGSNNVIVGVMDTGIDYTHPDLAANIWTNQGETPNNGKDDDGNGYIDDYYGYDFYNDDSDPFDDSDNGHGTRIAGIIGAVGNNKQGVVGVNWNVDLMALKIAGADGTGSSFHIIEALEYATMMGVKITNNSWGTENNIAGLANAIKLAGEAGMLFVASAGNEATNIDLQPRYPASYDEDNIITVAATNHKDEFAWWFSNYGTNSVDLAAPGVAILSTIPGKKYASQSGTSLAAPYVAGAAALLWAANPNLTVNQVKSYLLEGVDELSSLDGKVLTQGRLNSYNSLLLIENQLSPDISISDSIPNIVLESNSNNSKLTFIVFLSAASNTTVTVKYDTVSVTATEGQDYVKKSGTLKFSPGETSKTITVPIINDNLNEVNEDFIIKLSNATNAKIKDGIGVGRITDTLEASVNTTLPDGAENLTLTGNNNIKGVGNGGNNIITGNNANNTLIGKNGEDTLNGNSGNDLLNGGEGADTMKGGSGNDRYIVHQQQDVVSESANQGIDRIISFVSITLPNNVENLTLENSSNINGWGNDAHNQLVGNNGNNQLSGLRGQDTLKGGSGADILVGGAGNDVLFGETGNDQFVFNLPTEGVDTIKDFGVGADKILISANGFGGGLTSGTLPTYRFTEGTAAQDWSDRFIYNPTNGLLFFDPDGTGKLDKIQFAKLTNLPDLDANDFTIF